MRNSGALRKPSLRRSNYAEATNPKESREAGAASFNPKSIVRGIGAMDHTILLVVIILAFFGIMMVFSASYVVTGRSARFGHNPFFFLTRHVLFAAIGFIALYFMSNFNYKFLKRFAMPLYLVSIGLLIITAIFGDEGRWLVIPIVDMQFQPSEIAKVSLILVLARLLSRNRQILDTWKGFFFCGAVAGVMAVFVALGNLSTAIIIAVIGGGMIFMASPHIWRFVAIGGVAGGGMAGYLAFMAIRTAAGYQMTGGFRGARVRAWLNPFDYMQSYGFQIVQSLYAVASGGLFGLGIGQSRQKTFLPEVHNDVIFSVIVEELGFIGGGIILLLFGILIWRGLRIAMNATDSFGALVAVGIILMIASQVIINVAVVTNSIPNTGIPMPFISYGGTALLVCMACMGIILNISRHSKVSK